jgi:hypothetical protein
MLKELMNTLLFNGHAVAQLVEALHCKSEKSGGRGVRFPMVLLASSIDVILSAAI